MRKVSKYYWKSLKIFHKCPKPFKSILNGQKFTETFWKYRRHLNTTENLLELSASWRHIIQKFHNMSDSDTWKCQRTKKINIATLSPYFFTMGVTPVIWSYFQVIARLNQIRHLQNYQKFRLLVTSWQNKHAFNSRIKNLYKMINCDHSSLNNMVEWICHLLKTAQCFNENILPTIWVRIYSK